MEVEVGYSALFFCWVAWELVARYVICKGAGGYVIVSWGVWTWFVCGV
jgi:hypothetical protein